MTDLATGAPPFVDMAHSIVWATVATVSPEGRPHTRILHPIWEWDGTDLRGWILTSPRSPKAADLAVNPVVSLTYWNPAQDTATVDAATAWEDTAEERQAGWDRFANGPEPVGYDPSIIPLWPDPGVPDFGVLRLEPTRVRVMPGTMMTKGEGAVLTWRG
jgi:hypothetical protein